MFTASWSQRIFGTLAFDSNSSAVHVKCIRWCEYLASSNVRKGKINIMLQVEPLYGYVRTSISSPFFHQIVDFSAKSSLLLSRIALRESVVDPILVIERHFHLKSDTRDCLHNTQKNIGHSILIVLKKKICMLFKNCWKPIYGSNYHDYNNF